MPRWHHDVASFRSFAPHLPGLRSNVRYTNAMKSNIKEPILKEIHWTVRLRDGPGCGQFAIIEPELREYPLSHAPAHLMPVQVTPATMPTSLCVGLILLAAAAATLVVAALTKLRTKRHRAPTPVQGDPREPVVLMDFPRSGLAAWSATRGAGAVLGLGT